MLSLPFCSFLIFEDFFVNHLSVKLISSIKIIIIYLFRSVSKFSFLTRQFIVVLLGPKIFFLCVHDKIQDRWMIT